MTLTFGEKLNHRASELPEASRASMIPGSLHRKAGPLGPGHSHLATIEMSVTGPVLIPGKPSPCPEKEDLILAPIPGVPRDLRAKRGATLSHSRLSLAATTAPLQP